MSIRLSISRLLVLILCVGVIGYEVAGAEDAKIDTTGLFTSQSEESNKEKTMNDINTFLISSYKLKVDRVLAELNTSIGKATKNDVEAQVQLLKKIQGDIAAKEAILQSKPISQNRKKILQAIFAHIQWNLSETIKKISKGESK